MNVRPICCKVVYRLSNGRHSKGCCKNIRTCCNSLGTIIKSSIDLGNIFKGGRQYFTGGMISLNSLSQLANDSI